MKPFFSSLGKFNTWMTVCTLSATILGLPATAVAQEVCVITSARSVVCGKPTQLYVNNTQWMVENAENGRNSDYHSVPWLFSADGTVRAGNLWRGVWRIESNDTISVVIRMNDNSTTDRFNVKFISPSKFTAYKDGHAYRYAVRK